MLKLDSVLSSSTFSSRMARIDGDLLLRRISMSVFHLNPGWRDLVFNLVSKEIKVRYMGAALGFAWSLGNPLLTTLTYLVVFTWIFPTRQDRFVLYLATGMLHWSLFSQVVLMGCEWLTVNSNLLKKIYFPRLIIPISGILTNITFWAAAFIIYCMLYMFLGGHPSAAMLGYLIIWPAYVAFCFGIALVFSVIHALFRDLRHIVDVLLPLLFWLTPIIWAPSTLPPQIRPLLSANPLAPFFFSFEAILHDGSWPSLETTALCLLLGAGTLGGGLLIFTRQVHKVIERI